ncbi:prepilin-type N-terminal cleavage/methylation domain-containing protein [Pseudobacteriovorax antillogorgiicola]|uniref:Prepilin-type N-terminal cleavage/methylation domain-containing protein n=1 Tax=Pseudobacteriovorax antillogorgiicola TaxID=1513793 RepID=A0A1Y6BVR2_9BACT|nr:prepilin-type N-terminal cleavage/methylation domain-containing protein [Pseudobacteriovorax antillogorgiicola]TCS53756.1 prepilin-type N-terminal cleavage/methylation domain-containing protein [Pseudobacteriovorax antillogorgiicola]SMF22549.1 prepilin-type N-terminal cleavage/methylation domain-containing protein [Pseudobacteriovorax antillogorgiicola]
MKKRIGSNSGFSLIEMMISVAILSVIIMGAGKFIPRILSSSSTLEAYSNSRDEILQWMTVVRKNLYTTAFDPESPSDDPKLERWEIQDEFENFTIGTTMNVFDRNDSKQRIFSIGTRCIGAPDTLQTFLPVMNQDYLDQHVVDVPECRNLLSLVDCGVGQRTEAVIDIEGVGRRTFPRTRGQRLSRHAVAGAACLVYDNNTRFHKVYIWAAIISQKNRKHEDKTKRVRWIKRQMLLPPSNTGNVQYLKPDLEPKS